MEQSPEQEAAVVIEEQWQHLEWLTRAIEGALNTVGDLRMANFGQSDFTTWMELSDTIHATARIAKQIGVFAVRLKQEVFEDKPRLLPNNVEQQSKGERNVEVESR